MKQLLLFVCLVASLVSFPAFAKDSRKPVRPVKTETSNADLYKLVWRCTFTVSPDQKTTGSCAPGKFNRMRAFVPIPATKEHRTISDRTARFLTLLYGTKTYPYSDEKSKKPVVRPDRCEFELTHGETSEPIDTAVIHARSGTCPLTFPAEQFLFQDRLVTGLNQIVYEQDESADRFAEDR